MGLKAELLKANKLEYKEIKSDQNGIERRYLSTQIKVQIKVNIQIVMS